MWHPFKSKAVEKVENKSCDTRYINVGMESLLFLSRGGDLSPSEAVSLYNSTSAVSVPINWISEAVACLDLVISEKSRDGVNIIVDHPILDFIDNPNSNQTSFEFFTSLCAMYLICGETEVALTGNVKSTPSKMYNIYPQNVSVMQGADGFPSSIHVGTQLLGGVYTRDRVKSDDVYIRDSLTQIHQLKMFSTFSNGQLRGQSPLVSVVSEVKQNISGILNNLNNLENGGQMNLMFRLKGDEGAPVDDEQFQAIKKNILSQYSGVSAAKVGVIDDAMEVKEMGTSNRDMEYASLHKMSTEAVAKQYKFPLPLVSSDASTMNNVSSAYEAFYDYAVFPTAKAILQSLTLLLMPRFKLDPNRYSIAFSSKDISALESRRSKLIESRRKAYVETDNELREIIGHAPVDGGDKTYRPANLLSDDVNSNDL